MYSAMQIQPSKSLKSGEHDFGSEVGGGGEQQQQFGTDQFQESWGGEGQQQQPGTDLLQESAESPTAAKVRRIKEHFIPQQLVVP